MADELILMAEPREIHGKKVKRLRREGLLPGVVYGPVMDETVSVSVNEREFNKFFMAHGHSTIFTLKWEGGSQPVLIREVQYEPVRHEPLHVDFFAPNMNVKLRQSVQLALHNASEEIEAGGVLQQVLTEIEVEALPADLPSEIVADISSLTAVGDSLHVRDITVEGNIEIVTDPDATVASIIRQVVEAEETDEEAEEAVEGEAAEDTEATEEAEGGEE
ncbi:MAG TPA: 50S ribosomal protein L25 [Thermomicrobiales bacterium]|jgi:large subunit ribosomal protein L25|nr:50S ribosomal protein L25 [Thermomicrobiales bacterium]